MRALTEPNLTKPNLTAQGAERYSQDFESFWKIYPRKIEKQKAYKCWKVGLKKMINLPTSRFARGDNYAGACEALKTKMQFIKHPATILDPTNLMKINSSIPI